MIYVVASLAILAAGLAATVAGMALRLSGTKIDAAEADRARHELEKQLQETARELGTLRTRTREQMAALQEDIKELEHDLEQCVTPGTRRARLERLLSKTAPRENGGDPPRLPGSTPAKPPAPGSGRP